MEQERLFKAYIRWIFFDNKDLGEFVRNDYNNENWPIAGTYGKRVFGDWQKEINKQQVEIDKIETKNRKTRQIIADIRSWFINEHNRLKKEDLRKECSKCGYIKSIRPANKDRKKCEECNTTEYFHKRTLENPYHWEDLVPFLRETKYPNFLDFLVGLQDHEEENLTENEKVKELIYKIEEWEEHNGGKGIEPNPYEIIVNNRTSEKLFFNWKPIEREINGRKGKYLPFLTNYLFNYYGEWYEVSFWNQLGYNEVEIHAERSVFYNDYYHLLKSQAVGILHHSPLTGEEICSCPQYSIATNFHDFECDYELELGLYKLDKMSALGAKGVVNEPYAPPMIHGAGIHKIDVKEDTESIWNTIWDSAVGTCYFLLSEKLNNYANYLEYFSNTKWKKVSNEWDDVRKVNKLENFTVLDQLKQYGLDKEEMDHFLRYHIKATIYWRKKHIWQGFYYLIHNSFLIHESVNVSGTCVTLEASGIILTRVTESISMKLGGNAFVQKFLEVAIDTTLNDDKGQNNRQTERSVVSESSTNGGEVKRKETDTKTTIKSKSLSKGDNKGVEKGSQFLNPTLYSVDHTKSEYTFWQFRHRYYLGKNRPLSLRIEFNQNLLNQYKQKREIKGKMAYDYFNTSVTNQNTNQQELIGMSSILGNQGFLKSSIISLNMVRNANWFREKLEEGVFLWENSPQDFYLKKIPESISVGSSGGTSKGSWDEITVTKSYSVGSGWDDLSNEGGGFWVYKQSPRYTNMFGNKENGIWVIGGSYDRTNLLAWLMNTLNNRYSFIAKEDNSKWVVKHGGHAFKDYKVDIPEQYKWKTIEGKKYCQIHYLLDFFTKGTSSNPGDEINADHLLVSKLESGNTSKLVIRIVGHHILKNTIGDPAGTPPTPKIPAVNISPLQNRPTDPFDPDSSMRNINPSPTGGEPEINVPDIDDSPDFSFDPDFSNDPDEDPSSDPDFPPDPEYPPDTDPNDPDKTDND